MEGVSTTLDTLGNLTAKGQAGPAVTRGGRLLSMRGIIAVNGLTAGNGPFKVGVMNADLSAADIQSYFNLNGPLRPDDISFTEVASRGKYIRTLGVLIPTGDGTIAALHLDNTSLKGLAFSEAGEGAGWDHWIFNVGQALTSGASWTVSTENFLEWNPSG